MKIRRFNEEMATFERESTVEDSRSDESTASKISKIERTVTDLQERFNECKKNIIENLALCERLEETRREKILDMERSSGRIDTLTIVHATYIALLVRVNIGLRIEWDVTRRYCYETLIPIIDSLRKDVKEKIQQVTWKKSLDGTYELQIRMEKAEAEKTRSCLIVKLGLIMRCLRSAIAERDRLLRAGSRTRNKN